MKILILAPLPPNAAPSFVLRRGEWGDGGRECGSKGGSGSSRVQSATIKKGEKNGEQQWRNNGETRDEDKERETGE